MNRRLGALALTLAGCATHATRPARFVDRPAVLDVSDEGPIPVPTRLDPLKEVTLSDAFVKRPMVEALETKRPPEAGDVNALNEVPRSSWLSHDPAEPGAVNPRPPPSTASRGPR